MLNDVETNRIIIWMLAGVSTVLLSMVGFFLAGLYLQFRKLAETVSHIDKAVALHANEIRKLMGLPPELDGA